MKDDFKVSYEEKIEHSKNQLMILLPFLKQFHQEQITEKEIEAKIQGITSFPLVWVASHYWFDVYQHADVGSCICECDFMNNIVVRNSCYLHICVFYYKVNLWRLSFLSRGFKIWLLSVLVFVVEFFWEVDVLYPGDVPSFLLLYPCIDQCLLWLGIHNSLTHVMTCGWRFNFSNWQG